MRAKSKAEKPFSGKRTMKELMNDIKRTNADKCESEGGDSASSCDQSYCSADDLSHGDLKNI